MRTITLEEHFAPPGFLDGAGRQLRDNIAKTGARGAKILEQLVEIDDKRIADMDAAGIDMQVLSINAPGTEQLDAAEAVPLARDANEFLGQAVKKHPKRFAGLAALPTMVPDKAAAELDRCVREPLEPADRHVLVQRYHPDEARRIVGRGGHDRNVLVERSRVGGDDFRREPLSQNPCDGRLAARRRAVDRDQIRQRRQAL